MLISSAILLSVESLWACSFAPTTVRITNTVCFILVVYFTAALCLAIACAIRGYLAAAGGDEDHDHVTAMFARSGVDVHLFLDD